MVRYFAFLRAINVGGRRLTNDELVAPFVALGFDEPAAYQAAGNITFLADRPDVAALQAAVDDHYGFAAPVLLRTAAELAAITEAEPFAPADVAATEGRIQVAVMHAEPDSASRNEVLAIVPEPDRVVFLGREWFWLPLRGVSDSALPVMAIEKLVGPMTIRSLGTLTRMLAKFT